MRYFPAFIVFVASLSAQTKVSLRASGPAGYVVTGASNTTPVVVQTATVHGLHPGDKVVSWGVGAMVSGSCVSSTANGIRLVKAVNDPLHFSITDTNGVDVASNGAWCSGSTPNYPAGAAGGGKLTDFPLQSHPRSWLDGPTGTLTRKLALGTHNGLTSLVVSGNTATATTAYEHGIEAGDKLGVWGSGTAALNKTYTVTAATPTTFTFTTPGVDNGVYSGANNTCGPAGGQDCLRISQLAYTGNIWWDAMVNRELANWETGVTYKHKFDGGNLGLAGGTNGLPEVWALAAMKSIVDPSNTQMRDIAKYCVTHIERSNGVNWTGSELVNQGGNYNFNDFASYAVYGASMCYMAARDYLTPAEKQTFADKIYNDVDFLNETQCNKAHTLPSQETLASGTAQAGSSTTIKLAASDTAANGYYVNNVVQAVTGNATSYGLVTEYAAGTKTATVASWSNGSPTAGTVYSIYATATISSAASGATATITGINSHFTTDFAVGDAIVGGNFPWTSSCEPSQLQSYVTSIASDTVMTVLNSRSQPMSTTSPAAFWIVPKWQTGDCSLRWLQGHWSGTMGSLPSLYPSGGGSDAANRAASPAIPPYGGNNGYTKAAAWMALDLVMADDDARAITDLAVNQSQWWDWLIRYSWNYDTGFHNSGSYYTWGRNQRDGPTGAWVLSYSVPTFPSMDLTGPWIAGGAMLKMYSTYPDRRFDGSASTAWPARWGASTGDNGVHVPGEIASTWQSPLVFLFQPNSDTSKYFMSYLQSFCCVYNQAAGRWGDLYDVRATTGMLIADPRIQASDFTRQPTQYLFQKTSRDTACVQTGWDCPVSFRGDGMVSRTSWTDKSATHVLFEARTYWSQHDVPGSGMLRIYKTGHLLNSDNNPPGAGQEQSDTMTIDVVPKLGAQKAPQAMHGEQDNTPSTANIVRWASANHGAWDTAYGDAGSRYAYALADLSGMYRTTYNRVQRHVAHFKKSGTEEIVMQFDDIDVSNAPTSVETHVHYPQTGETNVDGYNEGLTTCPGQNGCGGLNTDRLILSQEDGGTDAHNPPRTNGIITRFFSPGVEFVRDDGVSYTGGQGHTHRVSICGGACGSTASVLESLVVHKITGTLGDTVLTAKALTPDPKWMGIQTLDKVALFARNGVTPIFVNVQTDHAGIAQYLVAGLQQGFTYRVYHNDNDSDVIRQMVLENDNTLYFEAPAGTYLIFPEGLSKLFLRPDMRKPHVGSVFQYDFNEAESSSRFRWSIASGSPPSGLRLSAAGMLSGAPTQQGTFTFTVKAESVDLPGVSATASITLQVGAPEVRVKLKAVTSSKAILEYGRSGLDASERCTITISTQPDFSVVTEVLTDAGGAALRLYVAGAGAALGASTTYYAQAGCGPLAVIGDTTFVTAAASVPRPVTTSVSASAPPRLGVAALQLQYGPSPELGSTLTVPCSTICEAGLPAMSDSLVYFKRNYLNADSRVVATSSTGIVAADPRN